MKSWIQKHPLAAFFTLTYAIAFGVTFTAIEGRFVDIRSWK